MVRLGDLVVTSGRKAGAAGTDLPVYSVTKHRGFVPSLEYFKKQVFSRDLSNYSRVESGEFAYATIHLDEGSIGIAGTECLISPMYTIFKVMKGAKVHAPYLLRYLKSPRALTEYSRLGKGSVHRRRSISFAALSQMSVPLPPLEEQRRIATTLDQADGLRAERREAFAHLDELTQCIFLDMFGDPESQTGRWPVVPLSAIVTDLQGGKSLVAPDSGGPSVNRVLKISAVTQMHFRPRECKAVPDDYVPPPNHFVKRGDLLFSRANTTELVGAMAYVWDTPSNLLLPDKLWRFVWTRPEEVEPLYIWALFQTQAMRRELSARSSGTGGSMKNISKAKLLPMQIPLPPYKLQERFRAIVAAQEQLKATLRTQSAELEGLFASLQSRAFAGEL